MKTLILGGTTFFGRRLVHLLLGDGHEVTIATRGQTPDDFGDAVTRVKVDRTNQDAMMEHSAIVIMMSSTIKSALIFKMPKLPWKRLKTALSGM